MAPLRQRRARWVQALMVNGVGEEGEGMRESEVLMVDVYEG